MYACPTFGNLAIMAPVFRGFRPMALRHFLSEILPFSTGSAIYLVVCSNYRTKVAIFQRQIF
jgi:hypothetical protein